MTTPPQSTPSTLLTLCTLHVVVAPARLRVPGGSLVPETRTAGVLLPRTPGPHAHSRAPSLSQTSVHQAARLFICLSFILLTPPYSIPHRLLTAIVKLHFLAACLPLLNSRRGGPLQHPFISIYYILLPSIPVGRATWVEMSRTMHVALQAMTITAHFQYI